MFGVRQMQLLVTKRLLILKWNEYELWVNIISFTYSFSEYFVINVFVMKNVLWIWYTFLFQVSPNWNAYLKHLSKGQLKVYKSKVSL
jgi:hypothetical protein